MMTTISALAVIVSSALALQSPAPEPRPTAALARMFPPDAIAYAEISAPAELAARLLNEGTFERIQQLPSWNTLMKEGAGLKLAAGLAAVRVTMGGDLLDSWKQVAGGGVAAALMPREKNKKPGFLMLIKSRDAAMLLKARNALADLAGLRKDGKFDPAKVRMVRQEFQKLGEVEILGLPQDSWQVIARDTLLIANEMSLLTDALVRLSRNDGAAAGAAASAPSLGDDPRLASAAMVAQGASAFAWVDFDAVVEKYNPSLRADPKTLEPAQALIAGGMQQSITGSSWLASAFFVKSREAILQLHTSALPQKSRETFAPEFVAPANMNIPRMVGAMTLRRDLNAFWSDHEGLVAGELDGEFAKFNNTAATIFGVRRMDEDVFPNLAPIAQFVFARQTYADLAAAPQIRIPAFAVILQATDANRKISDGFRRAFQTAVALSAADAAQKQRPALGLAEETVENIKISYATYPDPDEPGAPSIFYNFSPAYFSKDKYLVISSTRELARDLLKSVGDGAKDASALDSMDVFGAEAVAALRENMEPMVANEVLANGKTRETATRELSIVTDIASLISHVSAKTMLVENGMVGQIRLKWAAAGTTASRPRRVER